MNTPQRVTLSKSATNSLKQLSAKTGLSPNVVARFAMLVSFDMDFEPAEDSGAADLTINQSSLFGDIEPFLMSAFAVRSAKSTKGNGAKLLTAHIARGAAFLNVRIESMADLAKMCNQ